MIKEEFSSRENGRNQVEDIVINIQIHLESEKYYKIRQIRSIKGLAVRCILAILPESSACSAQHMNIGRLPGNREPPCAFLIRNRFRPASEETGLRCGPKSRKGERSV